MNDLIDPRASFSDVQPGVQIAWDSVSLGAFKKCPRYYQLSIVEGWTGKGSSLHLRYGILYHRALEVYDHKVCEGMSHEDALEFCLRDLAEGCQDYEPCSACNGAGGTVSGGTCYDCRGEGKFRASWWDPNENLTPERAEKNAKTIENLFRSVVWYLEQFGADDPAKTVILANGKPAVELSFRFELGFDMPTGEPVMYSGHLDRLVEYNNQHWVMDRKTTGTTISGSSSFGYFAQYNPDNQMSGYTLAGRVALSQPVAGVIIDAAQIAKGFTRFERGFTMRTDDQLEEWRTGVAYYTLEAARMANMGFYPMNEKSCNDYGGCVFRDICGKSPSVRHIFLASNFTKKPWDPLKVRGDV